MTPQGARYVRRTVLFAGPVLALATFLALPEFYVDGESREVAFTAAGRATLAMVVWMATWWMTEAVDIEVTALLPIALFPLLGITSIAKATEPYASDVIYLFLGGFILGLAIERWGLDRRIAFFTLRLTGTRPGAMVAGFMAATAFLSMWISNTACAAMMVPIAVSVIDLVLRSRTGKGLRESGGIPQDCVAERNFALGPAAGRRLLRVHRRHRHAHRHAAQRHRRALHHADLRDGGHLPRLDGLRAAVHARVPADRLAHPHEGPLPGVVRRGRRAGAR